MSRSGPNAEFKLTSFPNPSKIVSELLQDLCSPLKKTKAVIKLCSLATEKENRVMLVKQHGIVAPLLLVIKEDKGLPKEKACEALHWLALEEANIEKMVRECGVVEPLLDVVKNGTGESQIFASAIINSLSTFSPVREILVNECHVVDCLLDIARTPNPAQIYCLGSLHWLSHNPKNVVSFVLAGLVPHMLAIIVSETGKLRDQALGVIASMAFHGDMIVRDHTTVRDELKKSGAVLQLSKFQDREDGVGVVVTVTLANIIGRDSLAVPDRQAIRIHRIVDLLGASLEGQKHFDLLWPIKVPLTAISNLCISETNKAGLGVRTVVGGLVRVVREFAVNKTHQDAVGLALTTLLELSFMISDDASLRKAWLNDLDPGLVNHLKRIFTTTGSENILSTQRRAAACLLHRLDPVFVASHLPQGEHTNTTEPRRVLVSSVSAFAAHANALERALTSMGYLVWDHDSRETHSELQSVALLVHQMQHSSAIVVCANRMYKESSVCRFEASLASSLEVAIDVVVVNTDETFRIEGWLEDMTLSLWYPAWDIDKLHITAHTIAQQLGDKGKQPPNEMRRPLRDLSVNEVSLLLQALNLHKYVSSFVENSVDGSTLAECRDEADMVSLGVGLRPHARKLLKQIQTYETEGVVASLLTQPPAPAN